MEAQYNFICNGYSNYITGTITKEEIKNFTITFEVIPYTYESVNSGICSVFQRQEKKGFLLAAGKGGRVEVKIGIGTMNIELESKLAHLEYQKRNLITVAFWGTAGWCDLTINGVLSNRVQFPRHSCMQLTLGSYYLGKYVDGMHNTNDTKHGIFHGELTVYLMQKEYLPYEHVIKNHRAYLSSQNQCVEDINLYEADKYIQDIYRPVYHLMPPGKWMNEPHAPFYHKGYYHIFYQANPHAPVWDNLCWGHLISDDMVDWKDAGIALNPDQSIEGDAAYDVDGCWSGNACKDTDGMPILFYTAGNNKELPNQSVALARPDADNDIRLTKWNKEGVILRQSQQDGFLGEFRDPFVWRKGDTYYMLVGTGDSKNGGGNALVYTSTDLQMFTCHGFLVDYNYESCKEVGHVWELPVLLPLRDEAGTYICDILLFCACQIEQEVVETYYFLGKFNSKSKKFEKAHELPRLLDLGNGIFTGPSGFVTPDQRSVVFTIAQGRRNDADEYASGWAHNGGIPVALSIRGNQLQIAPIAELQEYFLKCILSIETSAGVCQNNQQQPALLENRIKLRANGNHLELVLDFGVDACHIIYNRSTRNFYAIYEKTGERISKCRGEVDLVSIGEEVIEMECFVDHSMIEVYLNERKSITLRNYQYQDAYHIRVQTDCDYQLEVWEFEKH